MSSQKKKDAPRGVKLGKREQKKVKPSSSGRTSVSLASTKVMRTGIPKMSSSESFGDGRIRIRHREYISDVLGSVAFAVNTFSINPGNVNLFPWLSNIASRYESYVFRKLVFDFETQVSASSSGSVMMAVDFDAADDAPASKVEIMTSHNAVRSACWNACSYRASELDLKKFGVQRYVRVDSPPAGTDIKTYDVGLLHLATQGEASAAAIGELYVEYDVELITPQGSLSMPGVWAECLTTGASRASPFTGVQTLTGYGDIASFAGNTITFNRPGKYMMTMISVVTGATDTEPTIGGTAASVTQPGLSNYHDVAALGMCNVFLVYITAIGQTVSLTLVGTCTTLTLSDVRIASYSGL